ncbi:hypothetical protein [Streptomyces sp. NPDC002644]
MTFSSWERGANPDEFTKEHVDFSLGGEDYTGVIAEITEDILDEEGWEEVF